jgi:hypothetical protein
VADARVRMLLIVALVLAGLRFAVVPWAQAQVEQRQQLEVLTKRLDRSEGVVANSKAILAAEGAVTKATRNARAVFPEISDKEHFRLEAQRQLAGIAGRGGVKVALFDWVLDGEAKEAGLAYGRVNASLEGPLDSLVSVHGQVEGEMPFAAIREVKVEIGRGGATGLSADGATMALVMDLYYRPAPAPAPAPAAPPAAPAPAATGGGS